MLRAGSWWALALFAGALVAFWPPYLSRLGDAELAAHVHAALMTVWLVLLSVQPWLVSRDRRALHRTLGRLSYALVPVIVLSGLVLWHVRLMRIPDADLATAAASQYLGVGAMLNFAVFWGLGIRHRRVSAVHGRYLLATLLPMADPVTARLMGYYGPPLPTDWMYAVPAWIAVTAVIGPLAWRDARSGGPARWTFTRTLGIYALFQAPILLLAPTSWWSALVLGYRAAFSG